MQFNKFDGKGKFPKFRRVKLRQNDQNPSFITLAAVPVATGKSLKKKFGGTILKIFLKISETF